MFIRRDLIIVMVALMAAALIAGCGAAMKDSGGDQTGAGDGLVETAEFVGLNNCFTCHNQTIFNKWLKSRHANFDYYDAAAHAGSRVDPFTLKTPGGVQMTYDDIDGEVSVYANPFYSTGCSPCHMGPDFGGEILEINVDGDVFTNPNIGQKNRFIIGCEACHGGGSFHFGVGALPIPIPGFEPCATLCHDLNFEKETFGAHHFASSNRDWANVSGDSVNDANGDIDPIMSSEIIVPATTTDPAITMEVWSLPDPADTVWEADGNAYDGPYYPVPHEVMKDTHFNAAWVVEDDKLTIYSVDTARLGYVNTANDSPNTGMVNSDDSESCTASCHKAHDFDLTVNEQWARGAHHPTPEGPVINDNGAPFPSGPVAWSAVDHGGFSGSCVRCHTSVGFAELNGDYGSTSVWPDGDGFITCNGCHDGVNYPTASNSRLRLDGDAVLFDNDAGDGTARLVVPDAGPSATCIYCHQGRESGLSVENAVAASDTHRFINRHYLAAAAILFGTNARAAYEYPGQSYASTNTFSSHPADLTLCVDCHLRGTVDHTFNPQVSDCDGCHTGITDFEDLAETGGPENDYDGDSTNESFQHEIEGLQELLKDEIYAYADSVLGLPIVYGPGVYPYFFEDVGIIGTFEPGVDEDGYTTFDDRLLEAAFNYHSGLDPCGPIHNHRYVIQSLIDSADDLDDGLLNSSVLGNRP